MKISITIPVIIFFGILCTIQISCTDSVGSEAKTENSSSDVKKKVQELLGQMSLVEKVGEMTQLTIDMISVGEPYKIVEPHQLDKKKLERVLVDLNVGSILNVGGHAYSTEYWREIITTVQDYAINKKKSGIPVLYGIDAIHGANYTTGATLFPQQIGIAATWNPQLAKELAEISAYETRASLIPWTFSPVQDLGRDPRWSRMWEGFGEDVLLASKMGVAMVEGYEGGDISDPYHVASCLKHFLGYSMPLSGKDRTPAWIPERHLREYFIPPFKAAIDAGASTIMICSGEMNGIPVHCNAKILTDLLRHELGFTGLAVTDWEDIIYLVTRHRVAKDYKEAIKLAVNAGIDMSMVPVDTDFPILLKELVEEGEVPMSRIDESVARILELKYNLGLFEQPYFAADMYPDFGSEKHIAKSLEAALESITLLKNEKNTLPLSQNVKVLVTGPTADNQNSLNGGWTGTWQGNDAKYNTPGKETILSAIRKKIGEQNVLYAEGTSFEEDINTEKAASMAKSVDAVIVCLGESTYTEKPGDIDDLWISRAQEELALAVAKSGKPVILVLAEGRPRLITRITESTNSILMAYLPGDEGGRAVAEILFGDYNPSGRLPFTYPKFPNALERYDHKGTDKINRDYSENGFNPLYEFGHGLSYTSFEYSNLKTDKKSWSGNETVEISIDVKNTGSREGKEVVQLFIADKVASITPSVKRLRGFEKVEIQPGETINVSFTIGSSDLAFVGIDNKWITEPGRFEVQLGGYKTEIELK